MGPFEESCGSVHELRGGSPHEHPQPPDRTAADTRPTRSHAACSAPGLPASIPRKEWSCRPGTTSALKHRAHRFPNHVGAGDIPMPRRTASSVANVDFPVPVAPPNNRNSGRSVRRIQLMNRYRRSACSSPIEMMRSHTARSKFRLSELLCWPWPNNQRYTSCAICMAGFVVQTRGGQLLKDNPPRIRVHPVTRTDQCGPTSATEKLAVGNSSGEFPNAPQPGHGREIQVHPP